VLALLLFDTDLDFGFRVFVVQLCVLFRFCFCCTVRSCSGQNMPTTLMRQNRHRLFTFPKLTRKCLFGIRGKSTAGVIVPSEDPIACIGQVTRTIHLD